MRIPAMFSRASIDNLDADQFGSVLRYADKYRRKKKGILLSGPPGVGKSYALSALTLYVAAMEASDKRRFDYVFVTAPEFFDNIPIMSSRGIGTDTFRGGQDWLKTYCTVPWLVINDLGKELRQGGLGEQVIYKLGRVLRARAEEGLTTHASTNLVLKGDGGFGEAYGESIRSLSRELFYTYEVTGEDRRRQ